MRIASLVTILALGMVVGCIGSTDTEQPSPSPVIENNTAAPENTSRTLTYTTTLTWSEVRYGTFDHRLLDGENCIWVTELPTDMTVENITVNASWRDGELQDTTHLDVRIDGRNDTVHNRFAYWNIAPDPFNVTVPGWSATDYFVYAVIQFHAQRDKTVRHGIGADVTITLDVVHPPGAEAEPGFRNAKCE